ncbi:transposase [Nocardia sp. NPDC004278]
MIALDFLDRYPTPQAAAGLTPAKLEAFCRRRGYSGRRTGTELLARLRTAPAAASRLGEPVIAQLIRAQVAIIGSIRASVDALDTVIAAAVTAHPYARLLADLPRVGTLNLAQIIGEAGPILERATSFDQLAAETGLAPVTRASGKQHTVSFRYATNRRARQALDLLDRQQPPSQQLGRATLHRRPRPRAATPARHPHPRPRLAACHLSLPRPEPDELSDAKHLPPSLPDSPIQLR